MSDRAFRLPRLLRFAALAAGFCAVVAFAADVPVRYRCPDIAGVYRVTGEDPQLREALTTLGFGAKAGAGSLMIVTAGEFGGLAAGLHGEQAHPIEFSSQYSCLDGWLVFKVAKAYRGAHAGESQVRVKRGALGLEIDTVFSGRRWLTLFSYESAYLGLPLPFTGTTVKTALLWPGDRAPEPKPVAPAAAPSAQEHKEIVAARKLLSDSLLQGVEPREFEMRGDDVLVRLRARRDADVQLFLRQLDRAAIGYEIVRAPVWSDRWWLFDIAIRPQRVARRP